MFFWRWYSASFKGALDFLCKMLSLLCELSLLGSLAISSSLRSAATGGATTIGKAGSAAYSAGMYLIDALSGFS